MQHTSGYAHISSEIRKQENVVVFVTHIEESAVQQQK
jgi:hypothetical protein